MGAFISSQDLTKSYLYQTSHTIRNLAQGLSMPIFENNEEITQEEIERQQKNLDIKIHRKKLIEDIEAFEVIQDNHDGGDEWENEPE